LHHPALFEISQDCSQAKCPSVFRANRYNVADG
jgi:hypothetical protein